MQTDLQNELEVGHARRPLSLQISIAAFLLSLLIASIVGIVFYSETSRIATESNSRFLEEKNQQTKAVISAIYKEVFDQANIASQYPDLQKMAKKRQNNPTANIDKELQSFALMSTAILNTRLIYSGIKIVSFNDHRVLSEVVKNNGKIKVVDKENLQQYSFKLYQKKLNNYVSGTAIFSSIKRVVNSDEKNTNELIFELVLPVFFKETKDVFCFIVMKVDFHRFIQLIHVLALNDVDFFLADKNDQLIYSPNFSELSGVSEKNIIKEHLLHNDFPSLNNTELNKSHAVIIDTQRLLKDRESISSIYQEYQNNQFGEGHLFKWLIQPKKNRLLDELSEIKNRSFMTSILLAVITLFISMLVAKKMIRPLIKMNNSIQNFKNRIDINELPIEASNELGVLARSFYNMQLLNDFKNKQVKEHQFALDQHAIVSATDTDGKIIFANTKFIEVSGYSEKELIGEDHNILNSRIHDDDFFKNMYKTLSSGNVWHGEICNKNKWDNLYWVDATIVPLLDNKGKPYQYISIRTDITDKKASEHQLIEAKNKAETAVLAKSEFFASMSHEIRTPMNGVLGMLGLMMRTELNTRQKHYATLARSSADSLLAIIDDILDLSKIEAGKIELEILDFNLREQLGIFAESMAYRAQDKGLEMVLDVTGIEHSMVKGDPSRLRQILTNLVGNAIKFTEQGEITVKAKIKKHNDSEWIFNCEVSDSGIGIPADKVGNLFDTYSQVDSSTTRKFGGTGLGLAIVKQLSRLMNGSVKVKSQFGKGSTFIFEVRLGVSSLSNIVIPQQDISGKQILIVDDNPTNLEVLIGQLEHWGASTVSATNGTEALEILENKYTEKVNYFDIAILDMGMPDMDGAELGQKIRDNTIYNQLKLVMMTSMAGSGDISKFKDIGFSAYFPKPATTSDLFHALQVLVEDGNTLAKLDGMVTNFNISNMTSTNLFSNAHILLVEDNKINQEVAIGILSDMGVTVDIAGNGLIALEKLKARHINYGLILMDCQMPEMDGYEATKAIRSKHHNIENGNIPIIALTANALKGDREKCMQAGMDDYLTKPIDPNELEEKLRNWLPEEQQNHHLCLLPNESRQSVNLDNKIEGNEGSKINKKKNIDFDVKEPAMKKHDGEEIVMEELEHVWDLDALKTRVRNNEKLIKKLVMLFLDDLPQLMKDLKQNIETNNLEEIMAVAHRIKGSSANLGAISVSEVSAVIERASKDNDLNNIIENMHKLEEQVELLMDGLQKYVE